MARRVNVHISVDKFFIVFASPMHIHGSVENQCSRLFHELLKDEISLIVGKTVANAVAIRIDALRLDLGTMTLREFGSEFVKRFSVALSQALDGYFTEVKQAGTLASSTDVSTRIGHRAAPTGLRDGGLLQYANQPDQDYRATTLASAGAQPTLHDAGLVQYANRSNQYYGATTLSRVERQNVERCVREVEDLEDIDRAWRSLAPLCLRSSTRRYLLALSSAEPLIRRLCCGQPSEQRLLFRTLRWLQKQASSTQSDTLFLPRHESDAIKEIVVDQDFDEVLKFFTEPAGSALRRWQQVLWRQPAIREKLNDILPDGLTRSLDIASKSTSANDSRVDGSFVPVCGAGLVSLWPLLPDLFRRLGLWSQNSFMSSDAAHQAAAWLDWLVWQDAAADPARSDFTRFLCGVADSEINASVDLQNDEQRAVLTEWLDLLPLQLPGWRTLKVADVRALFLARPGFIGSAQTGTVIKVDSQPFDVLLRDWPWPLTNLILPWLPEPIGIDWPLPSFDEL
jgi:hypothetical protein